MRVIIAHRVQLQRKSSMHPFSILTLGIFVAGYITARWDLIHQLYELAIFAWDHGVFVSEISNQHWTRAIDTSLDPSCQRLRGSFTLILSLVYTCRTHCCTREQTGTSRQSSLDQLRYHPFANQNNGCSIRDSLKAVSLPGSS